MTAIDSAEPLLIPAPGGEARVHLTLPSTGAPVPAALVLGHGAGGGVGAADLLAAQRAALGARFAVALVEQPYRVAGRRSPPAASRLDIAWEAVVAWLGAGRLRGCAIVVGGRSSGARVACRTARATGAVGVLCLAFPLQPPARVAAGGTGRTPASRQPELDGVDVPALVVQGRNDRFGMPMPAPEREIVQVEGDHGLKRELGRVEEAIARWLSELRWPERSAR